MNDAKPENYLDMQRSFYEQEASKWSMDNRDPVVGSYDQHNAFQYYDELLFRDIDTKGKLALEYGCGPGRNLVKFASWFERVDGTDISQVNLDKAKLNLETNGINKNNILRLTTGDNVPFPDESYDVVFSVICLQHIASHSIRYSIMKDVYRVLKKGGYFCFQMGFGDRAPTDPKYYDNFYDAKETNGMIDVNITDSTNVEDDLKEIGFTSCTYKITERGPGDTHPNWIWFVATK